MKKLVVFLLFSLLALPSLAFFACKPADDMQLVVLAHHKLQSTGSLEMSVSVQMGFDNASYKENYDMNIATINDGDRQLGYYSLDTQSNPRFATYSYYQDGHSYRHKNAYNISIEKIDFDDENLASTGINFDELAMFKPSIAKYGTSIYEISAKNIDLERVVDLDFESDILYGAFVDGLIVGFGDISLRIWLDENNFIKQSHCNINFMADNASFSVLVNAEVLSVDQLTDIEIPEHVAKSIESFKRNDTNEIFNMDGDRIYSLTEYGKTLEHIEIPYTIDGHPVRAIGIRAMAGNGVLKSVVIPHSVTHIEGEALKNPSIERIVMSGRINSIAAHALYCSKNLELIMTGTTPPSQASNAFGYLLSTVPYTFTIFVPHSALENYKRAVDWSGFKDRIFPLGDTPKDTLMGNRVMLSYFGDAEHFAVPVGTSTISPNAFANAHNLRTIYIPNSVTRIEIGAFSNRDLDKVEFELNSRLEYLGDANFGSQVSVLDLSGFSQLTTIGSGAFSHSPYLQVIYLPATIDIIESSAFMGCRATVYLLGSHPPQLGKDAFGVPVEDFYMSGPEQIFVPPSALDTYKQAWPTYANLLFAF